MEFIKKYAAWIEFSLNLFVPLFGILFLGWSIGNIFLLFFIELLYIGLFAGIKILCAAKDSTLGRRILSALGFGFSYFMLFFFILVLLGNFFNGADAQMNYTLSKNIWKYLLIIYGLSFAFNFILNGKYKRVTYQMVRSETLWRTGALFLVLLVVLLPFSFVIGSTAVNYFMGGAILLGKNLVDFAVVKKIENKREKQH